MRKRQSQEKDDSEDYAPPRGVDPFLTKRFLSVLEGVTEAQVWWYEGHLEACVVLLDQVQYTPREIQRMCMENLGLHQTPRKLFIKRVRDKAA
jgi:hypothetical protein